MNSVAYLSSYQQPFLVAGGKFSNIWENFASWFSMRKEEEEGCRSTVASGSHCAIWLDAERTRKEELNPLHAVTSLHRTVLRQRNTAKHCFTQGSVDSKSPVRYLCCMHGENFISEPFKRAPKQSTGNTPALFYPLNNSAVWINGQWKRLHPRSYPADLDSGIVIYNCWTTGHRTKLEHGNKLAKIFRPEMVFCIPS